jgi:hypothetical protein
MNLLFMKEELTLTRKQKALIKELDDMLELFGLDYQSIQRHDKKLRTTTLELIKNQMVRGEIIMRYVTVDELLNDIICNYFFGVKKSFISLWKTKRFQNFNYFILEELSLLKKLALARSTIKIPKGIVGDIERLNSLRNALAHAFFPENLKKSKPVYKGKDIFSLDGIRLFEQDIENAISFLAKKLEFKF